MRRGFGLVLLMLSLLWQSVVMAGGQVLPVHGEDFDHAVLHWQEEAHHHHEDGSFQLDDSGEALVHVQLDGALHLPALPGPELSARYPVAGEAPLSLYALHLPTPPPQQLRRPPRVLS